jgi:hypothetical protein
MGLTSWATFAPGLEDRVVVMGDLVLFEDEANPVMSVALDKEFIFVPPTEVIEKANELDAIPYDVHGVELTHDGELCSFDAFLKKYHLDEPQLRYLALIVRGADTGRHDLTPESGGSFAISLGLSDLHSGDDQAVLRAGFIVYDALYRWLKFCRGEKHLWLPPALTRYTARGAHGGDQRPRRTAGGLLRF